MNASHPGSSHGTACTQTASGHLVHCPPPVPKSKLPAGAKNTSIVSQPVSDPATLVDTRTWTSGGGNTYPGADVPLGMVQWSPDTYPNRSDGGGYNFGDTQLMGYSLTHISGPGCGAAEDVPILPMTGALPSGDPNGVMTSFTNSGEVAQAGYYSAQSNMPDTITSEFTATPHSSMGRFTFPPTTSADFLIKLMDSQNGDFGDSAQIVSNNEVTGTDTSGDFCGETNNDGQVQQYTVHFDITFSQPFTASQVITEPGQTDPAAVFLTFDTTSNQVIQAKVGVSFVSTANAQADWQAENPGWDFNSVKAAAQQDWNSLLGEVQVSGGSYAETQEFYSLLYKDFMQPNIVSDVNGQYMGADMQVHTVPAGQQDQYGTYSGWDIYHSLSQLQAMLDPTVAGQEAQSLLNYYSQDKLLQQWGYMNLNNYVMVGDPAQSIIADLYAFGARNFDTSTALKDMLAQATTVNDVRPGEALEAKYGYLPADGTYGCCNAHGVVATMLEYDSEDFALAQFASALGDTTDAAMLEQRANNWENLFSPNDNLLNPRYENGNYVPGIVPTTADNAEQYYVEGDAYEYLWDVPNDYSALFSLMGGPSKVAPEVRTYLSQPNGFGMFAQLSNEFDFGEQYMGDYAQDPAGTQQAVQTMLNTMQAPGPSGLPNNDDLGANSSTTIWEMLGMYPENSGSGNLVLNGPHFPHAAISLPNGKTITINAPAASASNYYVQNLKLNGSPYSNLYVPFATLEQGATMDWTMGSNPSMWGTAPQDAPPSYAAGLRPVVGFASSPQVTVAPGGSATVQVGARNATDSQQAVQASVSAPSGITVSQNPSNGNISVPPNGQGTETLTVQASASVAQTFYTIAVSLTDGGTKLPPVNVTVLVAQPGSLLAAFNNAGISADSDVSAADFDNDGNSYSAQALASAGLTAGQPFTIDGVQFTWPLPAPGYPDNAIAGGQQVTVNAPAGTQKLGFLGSADGGPSQGVATLHYSDGSTAGYWLGLSDWTLNAGGSPPSYGNQVAAKMPYRNCAGCSSGQQTVGTNVFYAALPVDPGKTLTSVTLPNGATQGNLHIFAIGTSTQALSPPVAASLSPVTASAGQQVTIHGSGFGTTQGNSYIELSDNGSDWGAPNLLASSQTGTLAWGGPFNDGCSTNAGGLASVNGGSGEQWTASCVTNQTWIQVTPSGLANGQTYTASVTLEAHSSQQTAPMFLDFYNGCADTSSKVVSLTPGTPVTLTDTTTIGCSNAPQFQVRTAGSGSVDLTATNASIANPATIQVDSWSDTAVTFTVPTPSGGLAVYPGSEAMVTVHVVNSSGTDSPSDTPALEITPSSNPADYYDNVGISPDDNTACGNYDGDGFSYSANALAADNLTPGATVNADGLTFTWPNVAACAPDNILASGQTMLVKGTSGASTLGLLGSSSNGSSSGTIVINYTDGTSSTQTLSFTDWAQSPGGGDTAVATMPYRNQVSGGQQGITMYVFATTVPVDSAKTVAAITFPSISNSVGPPDFPTAMHIFAVSLG